MRKSEAGRKLNVCILCGGKSPEHEISLVSASNVLENLDRTKYNVSVIGIGKENAEWCYYRDSNFYVSDVRMDSYKLNPEGWNDVVFKPGSESIINIDGGDAIDVDIFFPVLHGVNGEDGTLQGLIEHLGIPIAGCRTLSSAMAMDKAISKIIARDASIPVGPWISYKRGEEIDIEYVAAKIGFPLFIKPSNTGSSFGIAKVKRRDELLGAANEAFRYSSLILLEKAIEGREIEVAVLGKWGGDVKVSVPGEVVPLKEFYSYEAKYIDDRGADLIAPAKVDEDTRNKLSKYASDIFKALRCSGMSRVDFFIDRNTNDIFFNEINTIPGFTAISMYPKLWEISGIPCRKLLDELITIGIEG